MVRGVEAAGDPCFGHAHNVQHRVGPQSVRRVPDVIQGPVSWVLPVIANRKIWEINKIPFFVFLLLVVVGDLWLAPLDTEVAAGQVRVGVTEGVLHQAEQAPAAHTGAPHRVQVPLHLGGERAVVEQVVGRHVSARVEVPRHDQSVILCGLGQSRERESNLMSRLFIETG